MKQISFKNFRRFTDFPTMNLGDVTYLVGRNNAGKSTMVKAMILILENLVRRRALPMSTGADFYFYSNVHNLHIDTFDRAINNKAKRKEIIFEAVIENFRFKIRVSPAMLDDHNRIQSKEDMSAPISEVSVFDLAQNIEFRLLPFSSSYSISIQNDEDIELSRSLDEIAERIRELKSRVNSSIEDMAKRGEVIREREKELMDKIHELTEHSNNQRAELDSLIMHSLQNNDEINPRIEDLRSEIEHMLRHKSDLLMEQSHLEREEVELKRRNEYDLLALNREIKHLTKQRDILKKESIAHSDINIELDNFFPIYHSDTESLYPIAREIKTLSEVGTREGSSIEIYEKSFIVRNNPEKKKALEVLPKFSAKLNKMSNDLNSVLSSLDIEYLQAHLASQEIMMNANEPKNIFAKIIDNYYRLTMPYDNDGSIKRFILKWMDAEHFAIGSDFKIIAYPGRYYSLEITTLNEASVSAADMGMGTNQLLILLFQVANKLIDARRHRNANVHNLLGNQSMPRTTLFIEEPEQNLHPEVQSRLADFFNELSTNSDILMRFVVETHSEYIIRQSQVIVSNVGYKDEKDVADNNTITVLYFPDDGMPYDMGFKTSGRFINVFDKGFFDVASKLNLITLQKERGTK